MHPAGLMEAFIFYGARMDDLVRGTGFSEASFERQDVKISYLQQCQLIKNGLKACGLPDLGLRVGQYLDWCYCGSVGEAVYCSTSLAGAKAAFRRYLLIAQPHYQHIYSSLDCYHDKRGMLVHLLRTVADANREPDLARFELECRLAMMTRLYELCGNKSCGNALITIGLHYPEPAESKCYKGLFCNTIKFNCAHSFIAAPVAYVKDVWRPLRAQLFHKLMQQCEADFEVAEPKSTYAEKVYWCVSAHFHPALTMEDTAHLLGLSVRAFSRRLALEQTSFRQIFHRVKMELVCLHIRYSSLQPEDIAELVGFSSPSSLHRAIRTWRGTTGPRDVLRLTMETQE